jgi:tetratricopeptide (TPR) repeat protein
MEPIGTITQYFPFIDEETKIVLEKTMTEAEDYYNFVQRLCDLVLNNDSPVMVVYFAIHHAIMAYEYKAIDKIREKYSHHQILGPHLFYSSSYQGTYEDVKKAHEMADIILESHPEEWIKLEMNLIKFEVDMRNYPKSMYQNSTLEKIRGRIDSNPQFGFYESELYDYLAIRAHADGDSEERIRCLRKGLETAQKYDDKAYAAHLQIRIANIVMNYARAESKHLLEQTYDLVDSSLGIPDNFASIVYMLSMIDAIRGDYDRTIKLCLDAVTFRERAGLNSANPSLALSTFYNVIGEPESGLEWGRMAEEQLKSSPIVMNRAILNQIWSLVQLGRITEAQSLLDAIRESVIQSGTESHLAWLHFVTGILEREQGDLALAISSMEQGLKIYEQHGTALMMELIFLHQLAITEVLSSYGREVVSPSLAILEEKAISEDLPGILGQVLLLKADIAIQNNDDAVLREIIPQLRSIIEEDNIHFLKSHYESLQRRL